jgi:type VII secretion protein EssB
METTNEVTITLEKQSYLFQKNAADWTLSMRKSEVQVADKKDLAILTVQNSLFMETTIDWQEDAVIFHYQIPQATLSFTQLQQAPRQDQLRAMMNIAQMKELLTLPITFFLHPDNLVFDYNLLPKIAYRGLAGKMPPTVTNEELLLRQYKCLIIALFEPNQSFTDLYEGQLEIKKGSEFIQTILQKNDFEELQAYLAEQYGQTLETEQKTMQRVAKTKFKVMKHLSIWMSVLAVVLAIPLMYLLFFQMPFQNRMQTTDTAFLKNDYEAVISQLEPVKTKKIPFTQKYELAYSFVQGKELNERQKKVILNHITLRSDEKYLDYWIENGRGNLDEALDIARNLRDSDLILYGITQKIEQIRNDTKLSGTEKENQVNQLEEDYKKYDEKRQESLETSDETAATDQSSEEAK